MALRTSILFWWVLTGSNRRHSPCKGDALPAELSTRKGKILSCSGVSSAGRTMGTTRRRFLSMLGGGAAAATAPIACTRGGDAGRGPPNILMLVVDQERRWYLTFPLVPDELQAALWSMLPAHRWLADNGIRFANHYASGIPCSPARSTIYTGFHAPDTQI